MKYRWINEEIDTATLEANLPRIHRDMIDELIQADKDSNEVVFYQVADDFEVYTKVLVADGVLTKKDWELLCAKYVYVGY